MFTNLLAVGTVSASTYTPPFIPENVISSLTYNYWQFEALSADLIASLGNANFANCICLYGSGLIETTVTVYGSADNANFTELASETLERNGAHMIFFSSVAYAYYKVNFSRADTEPTTIRNLMVGEYIEFEKCLMQSHAPAPYQRKTKYLAGKNGEGQFLGRVVSRQGVESSYDFSMITPSFARQQFQDFVNTILNETYYLAWNAGLYPQEVVFGWTDENVGVKYSGDGNLMAASWKISGLLVP